jgi:small subunit ribosomal protein S19
MNRSIWKGPFVDIRTFNKLNYLKKTRPIYVRERNSTIVSSFLDRIFYIYNGKYYFKLLINKDHLGFKLGSFSYTKKRCIYKNKKKIKKKK